MTSRRITFRCRCVKIQYFGTPPWFSPGWQGCCQNGSASPASGDPDEPFWHTLIYIYIHPEVLLQN